MKTLSARLIFGIILLLAGCATPQKVKDLSAALKTEAPKLTEAHANDLAAMETYVRSVKTALDQTTAEANLLSVNAGELMTAWKTAAARELKFRLLARFDQRMLDFLTKDFPEAQRTLYLAPIEAQLKILNTDRLQKERSAEANPTSAPLRLEAEKAQLRYALTKNAAHAALIQVYDEVLKNVVTERAKFEQAIDAQLAAEKIAAGGEEALSLHLTRILSDDKKKSGYDPAKDLETLAARKKAVTETGAQLGKSLDAMDVYLKSDGYARIFAKDALQSFAQAVIDDSKLKPGIEAVAKAFGLSDAQAGEIAKNLSDEAVATAAGFSDKILSFGQEKIEKGIQSVTNSAATRLGTAAGDQLAGS